MRWKYDPVWRFREMFSLLSRRKEYRQYFYSLLGINLPWMLVVPSSDFWYFRETKKQKGTRKVVGKGRRKK